MVSKIISKTGNIIKTILRKIENFNKSYTILILLAIYFLLATWLIIFSSNILERGIIILTIIVVVFTIYFLIIIKDLCKKSKNSFCRKNELIFQLPILILVSILLGILITSNIYPVYMPHKIILGPISFTPTGEDMNIKFKSPSILIICSQSEAKNFIEGKEMRCEVKNYKTGENGTELNHILIESENFTTSLNPKIGDSVNFILEKRGSYKVVAYYLDKEISVETFKDKNIMDENEYRELTLKRLGLVGAFIIFSLSILMSFLKNLTEMINKSNELK